MAERAITHRSDKFAEPEAEAPDVEVGWRHAVALHETQVGLKRALAAAERDWQAAPTEEAWDRIAEIQRRLGRGIEAEGLARGETVPRSLATCGEPSDAPGRRRRGMHSGRNGIPATPVE